MGDFRCRLSAGTKNKSRERQLQLQCTLVPPRLVARRGAPGFGSLYQFVFSLLCSLLLVFSLIVEVSSRVRPFCTADPGVLILVVDWVHAGSRIGSGDDVSG